MAAACERRRVLTGRTILFAADEVLKLLLKERLVNTADLKRAISVASGAQNRSLCRFGLDAGQGLLAPRLLQRDAR